MATQSTIHGSAAKLAIHRETLPNGLRIAVRLVALLAIVAVATACNVTAGGPNPPKKVRIGYLETSSPGPTAAVVDRFLLGLRENGWEDGRNVSVEFRFAEGNVDRLPVLARELIALPVDVLLTATTQGSLEAKAATSTTPIVFAGLADPVGAGLVDNPARPGGNLTGTSLMTSHLHGKHLQLLKETVPGLSRIAVLVNPTGPSQTSLDPLRDAAKGLGVEPLILSVSTLGEIEPALDEAVGQGVQAMMALPDALFFNDRPRLVGLAAARSLPDVYWERSFAADGGFMAYGGNRAEAFRRAAGYVDKILKGARPGDLPMEQSSQFDFVVNTAAQQRLGLMIPPSVADGVTEWL